MPEQTWDSPDIPERELLFGRPAGSAMPLVWGHAEYLKLVRGLADGRVFDLPPQTVERYVKRDTPSTLAVWRFNHKTRELPRGRTLRVETLAPAAVHWSGDGWRTVRDAVSRDSGLGVHFTDLPTASLPAGSEIRFTFYWPDADRWEGADFSVNIPWGSRRKWNTFATRISNERATGTALLRPTAASVPASGSSQ